MKTPALKILEKYKQSLDILKRELVAKESEVEEIKAEIQFLETIIQQ